MSPELSPSITAHLCVDKLFTPPSAGSGQRNRKERWFSVAIPD
jgi:hypothetical protein